MHRCNQQAFPLGSQCRPPGRWQKTPLKRDQHSLSRKSNCQLFCCFLQINFPSVTSTDSLICSLLPKPNPPSNFFFQNHTWHTPPPGRSHPPTTVPAPPSKSALGGNNLTGPSKSVTGAQTHPLTLTYGPISLNR